MRILFLMVWCGLCLPPLQAAETWCLSQGGRPLGYAEFRVEQQSDRRIDHEQFVLFVRGARAEGDLRVETAMTSDTEGLVSVARTLHSGRVTERIRGVRHNGDFTWTSEQGAQTHLETSILPNAAPMLTCPPNGHSITWFDPLSLEPISLLRQDDDVADAERRRVFRVDGDRLRPARVRLFELDFDMSPCPADQARRRRSTLDPLAVSSIELPVVLDEQALRGKLGFEFDQVPGPIGMAASAEQRFRLRDGVLAVVVCRDCRNDPEPVADPAWLASDRFIDSDHPAIQAQAEQLARGDDLKTLQAMTRFVKRHLWSDTDELGYASASHALASRQGNCSEHAVLLAALARAAGIPARVVPGWVYSTERRSQRAMLQPHAWVQAYVEGRWQSFDAGQDLGFSAGHVALAIGPPDPQAVYPELARWRGVRVQRVVRLD
ncbi:MAG: transglutaminase domain-containing protein [Ahniella sp.]|nr:transglutaminase domain-containing protein [Ahniella sp.]